MAHENLSIAYGRGSIPLTLPSGAQATVIRKAVLPKIADQHGAVIDAFARPIGCRPLAELARGKSSACILICDITRPVPNRLFLRPMIETLVAGGVPIANIVVL